MDQGDLQNRIERYMTLISMQNGPTTYNHWAPSKIEQTGRKVKITVGAAEQEITGGEPSTEAKTEPIIFVF